MADSKFDIFVGGDRLDLYDNENIVINRAIKDVQDVTKVRSDYSNTFQVPASPNNNRIFSHYYNTSIVNGWDNNVRVDSTITLDGFIFKRGGVSIDSVQMEYSKPISYKITFYSKVVNLKDLTGDDTLQDLDLSAYDHLYDVDTVALGLTQGLFNEEVIYPMFSNYSNWVNSDPAKTDGRYPWAICKNPSDPTRPSWSGIRYHHLKPAIKLTSIIDVIETQYGVTFSGDFFTSSDADDNSRFDDIYLWSNHYKNTILEEADNQYYTFEIIFDSQQSAPTYGTFPLPGKTYTRTSNPPSPNIDTFHLWFDYLSDDVEADLIINGVVENTISIQAATSSTGDIPFGGTYSLQIGDEVSLNLRSKVKSIEYNITNFRGFAPTYNFFNVETSARTTNSVIEMSRELPPIKIIDLINSLIKMFNLVVDSDDAITYNFTKFNTFFSDTQFDLSDYIFYDKYEILDIDNFNKIRFNFLENDANNTKSFSDKNGREFGDLEAELEIKTKKELKIELPFGLPITEKLYNDDTNLFEEVPILKNFSGIETGSINGTSSFSYVPVNEIEPSDSVIIFYKGDNIDISTYSIGMTDAPYTEQSNDYTNLDITNCFECTPVKNFTDGTQSRYFTLTFSGDNEQYFGNITYDGIINQSLYNPNWSDYIGDIFDERTRIFKFDAILPTRISNTINLDNVIVINGRKYRINKFNTSLTTGISKFELINIV